MKIIALQTARKGSKSVRHKNTLPIHGKPLFLHNIVHAQESSYITNVYISTDDETICSYSNDYNFHIIHRPDELAGDLASHHDVILHSLYEIEKKEGELIDILVILLGNSLGAITNDLNDGIKLLIDNPKADSCMSVSEFNMFNPFRAYKSLNGYLETVVDQSFIIANQKHQNINDKQSAGDIFFFNGSFWICRRQAILDNNGLLPFQWLGKKILHIIQDTTMEIDAKWQVECIKQLIQKDGNAK